MRTRKMIAAAGLSAVALGVAGCASPDSGTAGGDGLSVVATTTIWGSVAGQVVACGGDGVTTVLIPVGADPHDYSASSTDVATMVAADLVVANGLGLEEGLQSALESASGDGAEVLEVAPQLDPLPLAEADEEHAEEEGEPHGSEDPHVWHDMGRAATAAELIGAELAEITGDQGYAACGDEVAADIRAQESELVAVLAAVAEPDRVLVTDHDALSYFAGAYGFDIAGVVIPGGSTLAEASSGQIAQLTATITSVGVAAIFSNSTTSSQVVDAVAAEVGDIDVVALYVDSVGEPGGGADTYQTMMLANARSIAEALS